MDWTSILNQAWVNLISGLIANIVWIVLIIYGIRLVSRKIETGFSNLIKNIPQWLNDYDMMKMKHYKLAQGVGR